MSRTAFVVTSLLAHGLLAVGLGEIEIKKSRAATAIEIAETSKPKPPPPEPAKVEPPPPAKEPARPQAARKAAAPPPEAAPRPTNQPSAADSLPDFGLSLSGGVDGTGIALPAAGAAPKPLAAAAAPVKKQLAAAAPVAQATDGCEEPPVKPKPRSVPQPVYPASERAAGTEGKVRVQLTVDETGRVVDVKLLQGLGPSFDQAALAAARQSVFEPGTRCGKPVSATFNISMRFTL